MVERFLPLPYRFVCLTDLTIDGIDCIPLQHKWPGWWSKCELWRDIFPAGEKILYFDLDTVIVGDLSEIASRLEPFVVMGDVYRRPPKSRTIAYQSSMMLWTAGQAKHVYSNFLRAPQFHMHRFKRIGDQGWLESMVRNAALWEKITPNQVVSYKKHCRAGLPKDARVVIFHGLPRPWSIRDSWAKECRLLAIS